MSDPTLAPAAQPQPAGTATFGAGPQPPQAELRALNFDAPYDLAPDEDAEELEESDPGDRSGPSLIEKLLPVSFADQGFLLPDGASAGRFALQTIRAFQKVAGRPKRTHLIYCAGPQNTPLPDGLAGEDGIEILTTDDPGAVLAAITPRTAGILVAPVRTVPTFEETSRGLLAVLREATDDYGIVFAFDETASGLCRTGMMWAYEWTGVTPDLMILGHGLAGEEPLAGVLTTGKVARGATPPAFAPSEATLELAHVRVDRIANPDFAAEVQSRSWTLEDRLSTLSFNHRAIFSAVVGLGLMQGLECPAGALAMAERAAAAGLRTHPMGNVLGLFPALTVREKEIDMAIAILEHIAQGME
ncbi:aminotransferase class III-fold pyridoxal phosphate-dependent enzyme [Xanthobacter variabilis]|uniref:aminotransferase class III-fold pyridoxal phosphate-dependent enzyme n=1 Tax=Xanthobacter variabilis TaxID=3119932 RepID=UPI00374F349C